MRSPHLATAIGLGLVLCVGIGGAGAQPVAAPAGVTLSSTDLGGLKAQSAALTPAQRAQALAMFSSAFTLWQSGEFDAAAVGFKQGLDIDPANGPANYYYGDILQRRSDPAAGKYMARAAALVPTRPEGLKAQVVVDQLTRQAAAVASAQAATAARMAEAPLFAGNWHFVTKGFSGSFAIASVSGGGATVTGGIKTGPFLGFTRVFKDISIDGDELTFSDSFPGTQDATYTAKLTSPTRMEGEVTSGDMPHAYPFVAEKK